MINPHNKQALYLKGTALSMLGDYQLSLEMFRKAYSFSPDPDIKSQIERLNRLKVDPPIDNQINQLEEYLDVKLEQLRKIK